MGLPNFSVERLVKLSVERGCQTSVAQDLWLSEVARLPVDMAWAILCRHGLPDSLSTASAQTCRRPIMSSLLVVQ